MNYRVKKPTELCMRTQSKEGAEGARRGREEVEKEADRKQGGGSEEEVGARGEGRWGREEVEKEADRKLGGGSEEEEGARSEQERGEEGEEHERGQKGSVRQAPL